MRRWQRLQFVRRPWRPVVDVGFVIAVLLVWQAVRVPIEGRSSESVAHAHTWLRLEEALGLDVETGIVSLIERSALAGIADWLYANLHVPVLLAFMAVARLAAPARYPLIRTAYVVSFLPAFAVIALYPLAPPRWLPEFGGAPPTDTELTSGLHAFSNSTAAAASQHFSLALLIGAASFWLWPYARLMLLAAAYPALVFVVIVGTAQHYVLDCVVGAATLVLALLLARWVHGRAGNTAARRTTPAAVARAAAGVALVAWAVKMLPAEPGVLPRAVVAFLAGGVALFWTPARFAAIRRAAGSSPWARLSTTALATLLAYLLMRQAIAPGFTDYWGYIVLQVVVTLAVLLGFGAAFEREGGFSWYTHLAVTANTWADTLGTAGHFYERHSSYDKLTHFVAAAAIVAAVADVLRALDERGVIRWTLQRRLLLAVGTTLVLTIGWEAYAYLGDLLFDTGRHKGSIDTTYDLAAELAGALVAVAAFAAKGQRPPSQAERERAATSRAAG